MTAPRGLVRRVALALGVSTAIVVLIAALVPRGFLVNDDPGLTLYLRNGMFTPWISPILVRVLIAAYHYNLEVPWYGLLQYALVAVSGAVVIDTCLALLDPRPGVGRIATLLGAGAIIASEILIAVGLTWTVVSISALGASMVSLVAHLHICQTTGRAPSVPRALGYGLLATCGYMLRSSGLGAVVAALLPLFGWLALGLWRARYLPRPAALIAAVAPLALVMAIQNRIPQAPGVEYDEFNQVRGRFSGQNAFADLDKRAPKLLERAGWTLDEYREFWNWGFYDDEKFTLAKVRRLVDTGGVPTPITTTAAVGVLRSVLDESPAAAWLFLAGVLGAVLLGWLRVIDPRRGLFFGLGYLACEIVVPEGMAAYLRFPQRVSLPFYIVAAFGLFVILAREIATRPSEPVLSPAYHRRARVALLAIAAVLFLWARNVVAWMGRPTEGYSPEVRAFIARSSARGGFIFPQAYTTDFDPLVADPLGFDGLVGGWGTFSGLWYEYLAKFGLHHFKEVMPWMRDNPNAYVLASLGWYTSFENWSRLLLRDYSVRLALVDVVDPPGAGALALFRIVSPPLTRGTDEWKLRERVACEQGSWRAEEPHVADLHFRPITFSAPYHDHASDLRAPAAGITVEPIDGGLRCSTAVDTRATCRGSDADGEHAGIHAEVHGLRAARFELALVDAKNIVSIHVAMESASHRTLRWRWDVSADAAKFACRNTFTVVPGYAAQPFQMLGGSAAPDDVVTLHVYATVKPGTRASFELRHLEVAEP